jgi:hypothetical protein
LKVQLEERDRQSRFELLTFEEEDFEVPKAELLKLKTTSIAIQAANERQAEAQLKTAQGLLNEQQARFAICLDQYQTETAELRSVANRHKKLAWDPSRGGLPPIPPQVESQQLWEAQVALRQSHY